MSTKLVVPLDGSSLAEKALPYAARLAKMLDAQVLLLHVVHEHPHVLTDYRLLDGEVPDRVSSDIYYQPAQWSAITMTPAITPIETQTDVITIYADKVDEAEKSLEESRQKLIDPASAFHLRPEQVHTRMVYNRSLAEIPAIAQEEGAGLIVMTTHGRSGLSMLILGSVATATVRHSSLPVILIRPADEDELTPTLSTEPISAGRGSTPLVVALDGSAKAEAALEPAIELAKALGVELELIKVVQPLEPVPPTELLVVYVMDPPDPVKETTLLKEMAEKYLAGVQNQLKQKGVNCTTQVCLGAPADVIADYARQHEALMIVMATHARGRVGELLLGSVAEEVVRQGHLPVMLVRRPEKVEPENEATQ